MDVLDLQVPPVVDTRTRIDYPIPSTAYLRRGKVRDQSEVYVMYFEESIRSVLVHGQLTSTPVTLWYRNKRREVRDKLRGTGRDNELPWGKSLFEVDVFGNRVQNERPLRSDSVCNTSMLHEGRTMSRMDGCTYGKTKQRNRLCPTSSTLFYHLLDLV